MAPSKTGVNALKESGNPGAENAAKELGPRFRRDERKNLDPRRLKRDDFSSNRHPALGYWWSMVFSENRFTLFGIML